MLPGALTPRLLEGLVPPGAEPPFARFTGVAVSDATARRLAEAAGTVVGVTDGAEWCQGFLDLHRPDAVRIPHFPHAVEYLGYLERRLAHRPSRRPRTCPASFLEDGCPAP